MKSLLFSMSVLASATLASSVLAAETSNIDAALPALSTESVVAAFIDGYADRYFPGTMSNAGGT